MKYTNLIVAVLAWYFVNTWPGSQAPTLIGPFRSIAQSVPFRQNQVKLKARVTGVFNDGEPLITGWWLVVNGVSPAGGLSLTAGLFATQADCEAFRSSVNATGEDTASACWSGQ